MVGVGLLAAAAFVVSREQAFTEALVSPHWLARSWRIAASVPVHVVFLCREAILQLVRSKPTRGVFRAVPFDAGGQDDPRDAGRRALAEALGLARAEHDRDRRRPRPRPTARPSAPSSGRSRATGRAGARMNEWEIAALVLAVGDRCRASGVCFLAGATHALAAFEVASTLLTTVLMLLSEGYHRAAVHRPGADLRAAVADRGAGVRAADGAGSVSAGRRDCDRGARLRDGARAVRRDRCGA